MRIIKNLAAVVATSLKIRCASSQWYSTNTSGRVTRKSVEPLIEAAEAAEAIDKAKVDTTNFPKIFIKYIPYLKSQIIKGVIHQRQILLCL